MLEDYNPNRSYNNIQVVKLTLQCWEFYATFTTEVRGNIRGFDVLSSAVENLDEQLYEEFGEGYVIELKSREGESLLLEDEGNKGEDFLKELVVSSEIISLGDDNA